MSSTLGNRIGALCGVAFAVLLLIGVATINVPHAVSDEEMVDWWSKGTNQVSGIISMYFVAASAIAFMLFFTYLRDLLNGIESKAGNAMHSVSTGAFVLLLTSAAVRGVIGVAVKVNDEPLPAVDLLRYLPQMSYALISVSLVTMSISILLLSFAGAKTKAFPAWFVWTSALAGLAILGLATVVGPLALPVVWLWATVASVAAWRSGAPEAAPALRRSSLPA